MDTHEDCAKKRELDLFVDNMNRWQGAQNGTIQRIEVKIDEIHRDQMAFYPALNKLLDGEMDRRQADYAAFTARIDAGRDANLEMAGRVKTLELFAKLPAWTWKALLAVATLTLCLLTILSLTHMI